MSFQRAATSRGLRVVGAVSASLLAGACAEPGPGVIGGDPVVVDAGMERPPIPPLVPWNSINRQAPAWYASESAAYIADNILYYQNDDGGWPKDLDMTARVLPKQVSTIDNGATTTQLIYLSKVFGATSVGKYRASFEKGLDQLFAAQYPNGGWPQVYPKGSGYHVHITFNDGAMTHVLELLRSIAAKTGDYAFVDDARAAKAAVAVEKGIACILACQIVVAGQKTGWCAQHDEYTLAPAAARAYELASESGKEGAGVLEFLMSIDNPSPAVIDAVQSAVRWFNYVQIRGIRVREIPDATQPEGKDVVVVADPAAPPLWARFYEIGSNTPFFAGRDGVKKYSLAEIENERRVGYSWYSDDPADALNDYVTWQPKWAPGDNALAPAP